MKEVRHLVDNAKYGIYFTGITKDKITKRLTRLWNYLLRKFIEFVSILQIMATTDEFKLMNRAFHFHP
jgi:hypothetical protein